MSQPWIIPTLVIAALALIAIGGRRYERKARIIDDTGKYVLARRGKAVGVYRRSRVGHVRITDDALLGQVRIGEKPEMILAEVVDSREKVTGGVLVTLALTDGRAITDSKRHASFESRDEAVERIASFWRHTEEANARRDEAVRDLLS